MGATPSLRQIAHRVSRLTNGYLEGTVPRDSYRRALVNIQSQLDAIGATWDDLDQAVIEHTRIGSMDDVMDAAMALKINR